MVWWISVVVAAELSVRGACPGEVRVTVQGDPGANLTVLTADAPGGDPVASGPCAGTATGLRSPRTAVRLTLPASGRVRTRLTTTMAMCDRPLQVVENGSCTVAEPVLAGPAADYTAAGPWQVGSEATSVVGRSGDVLPTEIWFPSAQPGSQSREYQTDSFPSGFGAAWTDVSPTCLTPRPVLIHSHGASSLAHEMYEYTEFLASHGWLVAAPEHVGNSWHEPWGFFPSIVLRRPEDVADTFDALLQRSADPSDPLFGCVDPDAGYVVSGNSFGGYTAYAVGGALVNDPFSPTLDLSDPRATAIVTFVPWDALGAITTGASAVDLPVLTYGAERDATVGTDYRDLFREVNSTPRRKLSFPDAGHMSFTPLWCVAPGNGCFGSFTDLDDTVAIAQTGTLSFLEELRGRDGAIEQFPQPGPFRLVVVP